MVNDLRNSSSTGKMDVLDRGDVHLNGSNGYAATRYFVGIEGGGTYSQGILLDEQAEVLARCTGGRTNQWVVGLENSCTTIASMVEELRKSAGLLDDEEIKSIGLGMSGADDAKRNQEWIAMLRKMYNLTSTYVIENDTIGSLATARPDLAGIVLISGTGSNCVLRNPDGTTRGAGGWGHMLGDEGSAYWIAHSAIKALFDHEDRLQTCPHDLKAFRAEMFRYFNVTKRSEMLQFYYSPFDKAFVANFCPDIARLALKGDAFSKSTFRNAGAHLGRHVRAVLPDAWTEMRDQPGGVPVICVGSVFNSWNLLEDGFVAELGEYIPELSLFKLCGSSAIGAAFLGAKQAGVHLPIDHLRPAELFFSLHSKKTQNGH